ncbi:hypothetical protein LIER_09384 [Lithospermum erythrorhizon]|uniref:Uncharacterized protein n=1 Tax=Lithospermum erythrorhizon TaxID=34254 RepID=A0AAV3PJD0_LITER
MEEALWAYRTTYRTPTQSTLYELVYGIEVVLPLEVQIRSLRVAVNEGITQEEATKLQLQDPTSVLSSWRYVLVVRRPIHTQRKNAKMVPKCDGPYVVQEAYTSGSYLLADQKGQKVGPINGRYLKLYYP